MTRPPNAKDEDAEDEARGFDRIPPSEGGDASTEMPEDWAEASPVEDPDEWGLVGPVEDPPTQGASADSAKTATEGGEAEHAAREAAKQAARQAVEEAAKGEAKGGATGAATDEANGAATEEAKEPASGEDPEEGDPPGQAKPDEQVDADEQDDADEQVDADEQDDQGEGEEATEPVKAEAARDQAPLRSDRETKHLIKTLSKQQKLRAEQEMAEAEALEQQAKEMKKRAKERKKLRTELAQHTEKVSHLAPELGLDPDRPVTEIPSLDKAVYEETEFITIQEGRSYVRILFDTRSNRYLYQVIEPTLNRTEAEVLSFLRETLVRTLEARPGLDEEGLEAYLMDAIDRAIVDHSILVDEISRQRLKYYLIRDFLGYGPVEVLMRDPMIEDISCDGPAIPIYLFHRQYESIRTNITFEDDLALDRFVIRLAQRSGKHISIAEPILDATLPDTSRLQATLSREVTTRGSSFTIRKFRSDPLTPPDLVRLGTMSSAMAAWYWLAMEHGQSLIMAGGTASGKTTTLNSFCQFIPPDRKVVSIEDTREINLVHENWIAGLTRSGFGGETSGGREAGSVDMYRLLEAALRQRPEYLLVGEVRGEEAKTLFQAMATGHATYSTLHADSVKSAVHRLENPPINVPRIMLETLDSISIQTQVRINQRMVRRVQEVTEIVGVDPETGDLLTNTVFEWDPKTDQHRFFGKSQILDHLAEKNNLELEEVLAELENRQRVIEWMVEQGIRHITEVNDVVSAYYAKPEALLDRIGAPETGGLNEVVGEMGGVDDVVE